MKINVKPVVLAFAAHRSAMAFPRLMLIRAGTAPRWSAPSFQPRFAQPAQSAGQELQVPERITIYAVDDQWYLTDLYARLLERPGFRVRTFNDRAEALTALKTESRKPALLITDYLGVGMPVDEFMQACREVHPELRILMASGFELEDMRLARAKPDRFIRKPFSIEEFRQELSAALAE